MGAMKICGVKLRNGEWYFVFDARTLYYRRCSKSVGEVGNVVSLHESYAMVLHKGGAAKRHNRVTTSLLGKCSS